MTLFDAAPPRLFYCIYRQQRRSSPLISSLLPMTMTIAALGRWTGFHGRLTAADDYVFRSWGEMSF